MKTSQERLLEGKVRAAREGVWVVGGTPPCGYDVDPHTKKLVINEQEASVVRMMHQWLADEHLSVGHIQKRLNGLGIPTKFARLGKVKKYNSDCWWSHGGVYYILMRTAYTGYHEWRGIRIPCPRIISDEVWAKGREQLAARTSRLPRRHVSASLLRGLIECGVCGRTYSTICTRGATYYVCSSRSPQHSEKRCGAPNLLGAAIDPLIWKMLTGYIQKPELLRGVREARRLEALQRELAFLDEALSDIVERDKWQFSTHGIPALEFGGDHDSDQLSRRRQEVLEETAGIETPSPTELDAFCEKVREGLDALDAKGRQELVALLIDSIVVTLKTVEVHVVFPVEGVEAMKTYLVM